MRTFTLFVLALGFLIALGCSRREAKTASTNDPPLRALHKGMPAAQVERILKSEGIEYAFDAREHAYHAIIRNTKTHALSVSESTAYIIHMDKERVVESVESKTLYTGP